MEATASVRTLGAAAYEYWGPGVRSRMGTLGPRPANFKGKDYLRDLPQVHRRIRGRRREDRLLRVEVDLGHGALVPRQIVQLLRRGDVPDVDNLVS